MIAPAVTHEVKLLVDSESAAVILSVSTRTLSRLTEPHGPIACLRIGTGRRPMVRYALADLESWIESERTNQHNGTADAITNLQENSNRSERKGTIEASVAEK